MVMLAMIGLGFILLSGIMNAIELRRFFKALSVLNDSTKGLGDKMLYPYRFLKDCLPKLAPIIPDVIFMGLGGLGGLGGGVLGFIIGMGGTCAVTLIIKIAIKASKAKVKKLNGNYDQKMKQI